MGCGLGVCAGGVCVCVLACLLVCLCVRVWRLWAGGVCVCVLVCLYACLLVCLSEFGGCGLEPLQANPTIIEDNCFIGARSEVVEGVIVEEGAVISMGVYIGQSTKIFNRETGEVTFGRIPAGSVVVSGNLPSKDGSYSLYCAVIVKQVDAKTRSKVGINELLRGI